MNKEFNRMEKAKSNLQSAIGDMEFKLRDKIDFEFTIEDVAGGWVLYSFN